MKYKTWSHILSEAHSCFNHKFPNGLATLKEHSLSEIWEKPQNIQDIYSAASSVVVEPNTWLNVQNDDDYEKIDEIMQPYYDLWEKNQIPKGEIYEMLGDDWKFIVEYVEVDGY